MMKIRFAFVVVLALCFGCSQNSPQDVKQFHKSGAFFGSIVRIDVCYRAEDESRLNDAVDKIWERFADINSRLSVYDPDSDINKINAAYEDGVQVGADTYQLVQDSISYHKVSRGVFDISIGPLMRLWKEREKENVLPTPEQLQSARALLGVDAIEMLPENRVRLARKNVKINIDSIGDGFAADEAAHILRDFGFQDFLVDASGELFAGGESCKGRPWRIGVVDPEDETRLIDVVEVSNLAVSTSGNYENYYEIQGKRWSHIINPVTGYPSNDIISATVIAPTAQFADFWSTALCVLNPEEGAGITDFFGEDYASMVVSRMPDEKTFRTSSQVYSSFRAESNRPQ
jgi:thiamine biosynthesis lipoprotein